MSPAVERFNTGVLVIGAGAAGLRASIELAERGLPVLCLAKRSRDDAHTVLAAGGINAALATTDPEDSWEQHAADTLQGGLLAERPQGGRAPLRSRRRERSRSSCGWGADFARDETAGSCSASSARTAGGGPATRATTPVARFSERSCAACASFGSTSTTTSM